MADDKVILKVEVDAKDAQSAINNFGKESVEVVKKTSKGFGSLGEEFSLMSSKIVTGLAAAAGVFATFKKGIDEAIQSEKAVNALGVAIAGTGEFSKEALQGLQGYANALSDITGIDDDVILGSLSLAKSFGITNQQAQDLVKAATNLSVVTGQDLDSAVKQLGGTFDGSIGKLANLGSEFRDLTAEQAKNGAVIALVNKNYSEAGATLGDSFQGNLNRLENSFNDVFKAIGQQITGDASIKAAIKQLADLLISLIPVASQVASALVAAFKVAGKVIFEGLNIIATGIGTIVTAASKGLSSIAGFVGLQSAADALDNFGNEALDATIKLGEMAGRFGNTSGEGDKLSDTLKRVSDNAKKAGKDGGKAAQELADKFKKSQEEANKFVDTIIKSSGSEVEQIGKKAGEQFELISKYYDQGLISFDKAEMARLSIASEVNDKIGKINKERTKENLEFLEKEQKAQEKFQESLAAGAVNAGTTALKAEDQKSRFQGIGSVVSGVLSAYLGPLGAVLGNFITELSTSNKATIKLFISEFVRSAPDFVKALADNFPEVIKGLFDVLRDPEFWRSAAEAYFLGLRSLYLGMYAAIFDELGINFDEAFSRGLNNFASGFKNFFNDLSNALKRAGSDIAQAFFEPVNKLIEFLSGFKFPDVGLGGGGGGDNVFEQGRKKLGLAKGGIVPAYAANGMFVPQGTDTVPAMLTPGELVVPRDMVGQLGQFLDTGSTGGQQEAILMAILQAVQSPMTVQSEVKVKEQAFADIILQLNRQNARLSA